MWYKEWFADEDYLAVYEHRDEREAVEMLDLIERTIGRDTARNVLDLACGSGRLTIALASRGYTRLTGIDLSETLLERAALESRSRNLTIDFHREDMRHLNMNAEYDLVINLFTSFGYFETDEENQAVLDSVAKALLPGGCFVIDFLSAPWVIQNLADDDRRVHEAGMTIEQSRWIRDGRVEKRIVLRKGETEKRFIESVRLYPEPELSVMLAAAGLKVSHRFGTYNGEPYLGSKSPRLIMFASR